VGDAARDAGTPRAGNKQRAGVKYNLKRNLHLEKRRWKNLMLIIQFYLLGRFIIACQASI
jgi:hypothetical protein